MKKIGIISLLLSFVLMMSLPIVVSVDINDPDYPTQPQTITLCQLFFGEDLFNLIKTNIISISISIFSPTLISCPIIRISYKQR